MCLEILDGAIFIADSHEDIRKNDFWEFLCQIENGNIVPTQLFLMGDMFDFLASDAIYTCKIYEKYIKKIDNLALKFPIFYFEGNHDYNLQCLFKNVKVFSFKQQPQIFKSQIGDILLSHGDRYGPFIYQVYTFFIRSSIFVGILNFFDKFIDFRITKRILKSQNNKNLCRKMDTFESYVKEKLKKYNTKNIKAIFEGHHHQNKNFSLNELIYYNFSSFACDKSYFVVQFAQGIKITQLKLRGSDGNIRQ